MKLLLLLFWVVMGLTMPLAAHAREKVILDTDMVELFDDGVAMVMLARSPLIELVGVTTVSGNTWAAEGVAYAVRQLELANRTDIPVAAGLEYPLRPQRHELFEMERKLNGMGRDAWVGAFGTKNPTSWQAAYQKQYGKPSSTTISELHAVDFIINTVRANPGEITIAAIGPCGNIALAIRKAPDIVPLIKRVIYMGGSFFKPGNVTPAAEFNWWFDPEAARIVVRSPIKEQIVLGLDVCEKIGFKKPDYDRFQKTLSPTPFASMLSSSKVAAFFAKKPEAARYIWDVLVAAMLIDPSLVTSEETHPIDVNDVVSPSYGQSLAYIGQGPLGSQKARIILEMDQKRFLDMLNDPIYWTPEVRK